MKHTVTEPGEEKESYVNGRETTLDKCGLEVLQGKTQGSPPKHLAIKIRTNEINNTQTKALP